MLMPIIRAISYQSRANAYTYLLAPAYSFPRAYSHKEGCYSLKTSSFRRHTYTYARLQRAVNWEVRS
jgi:hypothetical protein